MIKAISLFKLIFINFSNGLQYNLVFINILFNLNLFILQFGF